MKFSVLISAYNRGNVLNRCLDSIFLFQGGEDFEVVLVNDGSPDNTKEVCGQYDERLVYLENQVRQERARSYGKAIQAATGDWIFHMGSDDMVFPRLFEFIHSYTTKYPEAKLFNYGWAAINKRTNRFSTTPGHVFPDNSHFNSGLVAAGSFCWHKSINDQIQMPDAGNCYELADMAGIPGYSKFTRTLGNPWGEDYYIFWKLTRQNISQWIPLFGVIVNSR